MNGCKSWIGCAGWSLPRAEQANFPAAGSHLERYASRFDAVEINSSFHRPHRPATYARWSAAVPASFRFAVKVPKTITHGLRLRQAGDLLETFLAEASGLGDKLGCLLVQLPPSLDFEPATSWPASSRSSARFRRRRWLVSRVIRAGSPRRRRLFSRSSASRGSPPIRRVCPGRGAGRLARVSSYYRLHGSPKMYYSAYTEEYLEALAARLRAEAAAGRNVWCIFDNTTLGAATRNALDLRSRLGEFFESAGERGQRELP